MKNKNTEKLIINVLNENNIKNKKLILNVLSDVEITLKGKENDNNVLSFLVDYTGLNFEQSVHLLSIVNPKILTININQYFNEDYYGMEYCNA